MDNYFPKIDKNLSNFRIILLFVFAVICFYYIVGVILFGKNSLDVLIKLEKHESDLKKEIRILLKSNERLQKAYFELKNLES